MKPDIDQLMKEAQKMQAKMQEAQKQLEQMTVTGEAGAGLVKVQMTGRHDLKKVMIDDSVVDIDEKDVLEDLIAAAVNDAVRKIEKETRGKMADLTKGLDLPPEMRDVKE